MAWIDRVTDANRCGLDAGERALAAGVLQHYAKEVIDHLNTGCWSERQLNVPKVVDWLPEEGRFVYDEGYFTWRQA